MIDALVKSFQKIYQIFDRFGKRRDPWKGENIHEFKKQLKSKERKWSKKIPRQSSIGLCFYI